MGTPKPPVKYDPESYWAERYRTVDITKSGHIDLPVAYNRWLYRLKRENLLRDLRKAGFTPADASILEVAAGTGVYVEAWKAGGAKKVVGIDISESAVANLRVKFPGYTFHKRNLAEPGMPDLTGTGFDLVTAVDMLYHITEDADFPVALANLAGAVKPGGLLAIHDVFPNHGELDFGYIKLRTLEVFRAALDAAGFDIVSRTPTFFFSVQAHDIKSDRLRGLMTWLWARVTNPAIARAPEAMGRLTYWVDRALAKASSEGPAFEMMICKRRARA